jgi:hypothetical protein
MRETSGLRESLTLSREMRRYQEDQAADTERLQPTISTRRRVTVIGNRILLVLVLVPRPSHTESYMSAPSATTTSC